MPIFRRLIVDDSPKIYTKIIHHMIYIPFELSATFRRKELAGFEFSLLRPSAIADYTYCHTKCISKKRKTHVFFILSKIISIYATPVLRARGRYNQEEIYWILIFALKDDSDI